MPIGTSVDEILALMRAKRRRLPFEIGAFVALQATEALLERPYRVDGHRILVRGDGKVVLDAEERCDEAQALEGVRAVLASLLAAAGEGLPKMMLAFVEPDSEVDGLTLGGFRDALEASLVPLNRSAAERVLARTVRDLRREPGGTTERAIDAADADFDALIEGRVAPNEPAVVIGSPDLHEPAPKSPERAALGDKRSIFRDDPFERDADDEAPQKLPVAMIVAIVAVALAAIGALVYAVRG